MGRYGLMIPSSGDGAARHGVVALVAVAMLAGCSFLPSGLGPTDATPSGTAIPSNGTSTPANETDAYPAGYDADAVVDPDAAIDAHARGLLTAESFYLEYNGSAVSDDRTASVYSAQVVNLSTDRAYVVSVVQGAGSTVQYFSGDTVYVQRNPPGENDTSYDSSSASVEPDAFTGRGLYGPLLRYVEWENAGPAGDNGSFVHYRGESLAEVKPVLGEGVDRENVSEFRASLIVGRDGIVRQVVYGATVERTETSEVSVSVTTRQIGNTTVEAPEWLDRARSS